MNRTTNSQLATSSSKPRREGSSRLRPAPASDLKPQQSQQTNEKPSASRVRIDALSVSELRTHAYELTVKNEEYKQRLKVAHEMFVSLQEAYQRLKQRKRKEFDAEKALKVEKKNKVEEEVVPRQGGGSGTPSSSTLMKGEGNESITRNNYASIRWSPRNHAPNGAADMDETPRSAVTASQLPEGLIASPENLKLAALTEDEDKEEDFAHIIRSDGLNGSDEHGMEITPRAVRGTGRTQSGHHAETPQEAITIRKRLVNQIKSPVWETIQKKKRNQTHVHLGHENVPSPEKPIEGLNLLGDRNNKMGVDSGPQLDEERAFKYLEVVRKQEERAKLPAGFCADCARFYRIYAKHGNYEQANAMAQRLCGHTVHQQTSRHRQRWQAPDSPEDFWHLNPPEPHT